MKLNWNFLGGGGECKKKKKSLPWGSNWIFSGTAQFCFCPPVHASAEPEHLPVSDLFKTNKKINMLEF